MDLAQEIARLRRWNGFFLICFLVLLGAWFYGAGLERLQKEYRKVKVRRTGDELSVYSLSDGPYLLTHVVSYGYSESDLRWAILKEPVLVIGSGGAGIDLTELEWKVGGSQPTAMPPESADIDVLFVDLRSTTPDPEKAVRASD